MTGTLFSGLMISQSVLATFGIHLAVSGAWRSIHFMLSDLSVIMLGVHFALHLKWVGTNLKRYVLNPILGLLQQRALPQALAAQPMQIEKPQ